jgi:hypothetical protein
MELHDHNEEIRDADFGLVAYISLMHMHGN